MLPYFYSPCVKGGTRITIIIVVRGLAGDRLCSMRTSLSFNLPEMHTLDSVLLSRVLKSSTKGL